MFRVSQHPSSGVIKTVTAASGTGHNIGTATSLQRGLIGPRWREVAVNICILLHLVGFLLTWRRCFVLRKGNFKQNFLLHVLLV